jgi:hypothetical protein
MNFVTAAGRFSLHILLNFSFPSQAPFFLFATTDERLLMRRSTYDIIAWRIWSFEETALCNSASRKSHFVFLVVGCNTLYHGSCAKHIAIPCLVLSCLDLFHPRELRALRTGTYSIIIT